MSTKQRFATRIIEILRENVPQTRMESFMATLAATVSSAEDEGLRRIDVFNEVSRMLAEQRQRAAT